MRRFYEPIAEQLSRLDVPWICSYSGGKDSTSLVTWMEYMRRMGWITAPKPRLVMSDTGVEYPFLRDTCIALMKLLTECGWQCDVVKPKTREKLYCQIFGRGITPIYPGISKMRWCTRATKISPMDRVLRGMNNLLMLTGVRWGESKMRDQKLLRSGCRAGGECGLPAPDENRYAAIIDWTDCQVYDWLKGHVAVEGMDDVFAVTGQLMKVYRAKKSEVGFALSPQKVSLLRFGCVGCPATRGANRASLRYELKDIRLKHLKQLWIMWDRLRRNENRVVQIRDGRNVVGPIKMSVRMAEFSNFLDIQEKSGVKLVTKKDIRFIHWCWKNKVYPRGWREEDEKTKIPFDFGGS